jgi:hypothetical protein
VRAGLSDTILKWDYPRTIPAKFGLIWFSGFREDLNVIFYQNMPNLHNRYKSAERNISKKTPEYIYAKSGFFCEIFSASLFRLGILCDTNHIKIFCSEI